MPFRVRVATVAIVVCTALIIVAPLSAQTTYYLKGTPDDQANKNADLVTNTPGAATFDTTPPTGAVPVTQTGSPFTNQDFVCNPLGIYWSGSFSGTVSGVLDVQWYWSTPNAETIALGGAVQVSVFADPNLSPDADRQQPGTLIGRAIVPLTGITAAPTLVSSQIPVSGTVNHLIVIQAVPQFVDSGEGIFVYYNSTLTPSSFTFHSAPQRVPFPAATPATGAAPRYSTFTPSATQLAGGLGIDAGEPSIGANWVSGNVLFQSLLTTFRVSFDDSCPTSPSSTWVAKQSPITGTESFDPILWTDSKQGHTIVSQLMFGTTTSASAMTDDDGNTWLPSYGAGIASGIDHQTLGGGPFHAPIPNGAIYPNAVYYCAQDIALANCAISLDGGRTYGPAVPIYTSQQCGGLHGHVKVGPDGTAYVPNKGCGGQQAVVVTENNGATWDVRKVPNSMAANSDPSVGISKNGRVYFGFADNDNKAVIALSDDHGKTWHDAKDVGALAGVNNTVFSEVVAGDDDRAAFAYLGTTAKGSLQDRPFPGVWYLFISTTYDGGATWYTVNATPNDPVQRGPVWLNGGAEISRNLLDFNDATIDREGRLLVGLADGCVDGCAQAPNSARGNSYSAVATIVRQTGGRRLFAQYDPSAAPTVPGAPSLIVTRNGNQARLTWSEANDGGTPISAYTIYRNGSAIGTTSGSSYTDPNADPNTTYTYRVTATSSAGTSCGANDVTSAPAGSSCVLPGVRMIADATGDGTAAASPALDIQSVSIAEPYYVDGSKKLVLTMKVGALPSPLPPLAIWRLLWNFPTTDTGQYYVEMHTDSNGVPAFEYGTLDITSAVVTAVGQPHPLGTPDSDSTFLADGTIRFVLSTDKIGNAAAGDVIGGLLARTFIESGSVATSSRTAVDLASAPASYMMVGNGFCAPPAVTCLDDDATQIAYGNGWHNGTSSSASGGHFRYASGKPTASLAFTVPAGQFGAVTYNYAKSPKGGSAEIFLDGVSQGTISFAGTSGSTKDPQFGSSKRFGGLQSGNHTLEIRGDGLSYVDGFCLESSASNASPSAGPGATANNSSTLSVAQELVQQLSVPANAKGISVIAEATGGVAKIVLVDPSGLSLAVSDTSGGLAVINAPVSAGGVYLLKTTNLSAGPVSVWTAFTPYLSR